MEIPKQRDFQCIPVNEVRITSKWNTQKNTKKEKEAKTLWLPSSSCLQSWWEWQMLMQCSAGNCAKCFDFFFFFKCAAPIIHVSTPDLWACHAILDSCTHMWHRGIFLWIYFFFNSCPYSSKKCFWRVGWGVSFKQNRRTRWVARTDFTRILHVDCHPTTSRWLVNNKMWISLQMQLRCFVLFVHSLTISHISLLCNSQKILFSLKINEGKV